MLEKDGKKIIKSKKLIQQIVPMLIHRNDGNQRMREKQIDHIDVFTHIYISLNGLVDNFSVSIPNEISKIVF